MEGVGFLFAQPPFSYMCLHFLLFGSFTPGDGPLHLGVLFAGKREPGEALPAGRDGGLAGGGLDAGGEVLVVGEGDDEGFPADDPGHAGVGHRMFIPLHVGEVEQTLHNVAIGGEELRVSTFPVEGIGERLVRLEGTADGLGALPFAKELVVPEVVEVIGGAEIMAE